MRVAWLHVKISELSCSYSHNICYPLMMHSLVEPYFNLFHLPPHLLGLATCRRFSGIVRQVYGFKSKQEKKKKNQNLHTHRPTTPHHRPDTVLTSVRTVDSPPSFCPTLNLSGKAKLEGLEFMKYQTAESDHTTSNTSNPDALPK
jgi:hypothetical protein